MLDEASDFAQQALAHRLEHEGPEAWWTNRQRFDLARLLHKLGQGDEAMILLKALQSVLNLHDKTGDDDRRLLDEILSLRNEISYEV